MLQQPIVDTSSSETISVLNNHETEVAQLVFVLISALTLPYTPVPDLEPGMVHMKINCGGFNSARWDTDSWEHMSQRGHSFDEDITFDKLLVGSLLPSRSRYRTRTRHSLRRGS